MKSAIKILLAFPLFLFVLYNASCDYVDNPIAPVYGDLDTSLYPGPGFYVFPEFSETFPSSDQNILIEDFTGHRCGNCPGAAVIAHDLKEANPGRVFVASVHASPTDGFQYVSVDGDGEYPKYSHDFRTPEGNDYVVDINGFTGNPEGMVNRKIEDGSNWRFAPFWPEVVNDILSSNDPLMMNIQVETNYYTETRGLFVHVQSKTLEAINGDYTVVVYLIQNEDIDWQKDYSLPSEEQDVEEYHHKDVFLGTINGAYGTPLFSGDAPQDEFFENHYSYEIPENIDIIGNSAGEETGLSIIAYLMDNASYEIIQVTEVAIPITY